MILQEQTTIQLDENRIITIESLFQIRTYRNLLCGIPTRELNKSAIESTLKSAKQYIENT
jgi:hypothetical protein